MKEMNLSLRAGDHRTPPPRSVRFFNSGADWYFSTREDNQMGPFYSKSEAREALHEYIESLDAKSEADKIVAVNFTSSHCVPTV